MDSFPKNLGKIGTGLWRIVTIPYIIEIGVVLLTSATIASGVIIATYPINSRAGELLDVFRIRVSVVDIVAI